MRLDKYLTDKLLETRTQAIYFIKSSKIKVNDKIVTKPSYILKSEDIVTLIPKHIYVSKGGYKLEAFLNKINFSINNKVILDIGCSTGGFTNYFLVHNAKKIIAIDIAKDILSKKLLNNKNLIYYDDFDILNINNFAVLNQKFDVISIDVSDVSIKEVLKLIPFLLKKSGSIIALFKPHYEGKKGIVSKIDKEKQSADFENWLLQNTPFKIIHKLNSSERGGYKLTGNREIFYLLKYK
ncbi:MAG: SAM-dependent methyltransferase [Candidatus ainarchaeum sp.]|jgi:23S rRNA (cytidine1920-2'-O)/16S rRNA (cytidine1409-2'-O)-methyltransferase|nr:SAM-dependent methyltransferase [Candidatus ainarchaeum sp.]